MSCTRGAAILIPLGFLLTQSCSQDDGAPGVSTGGSSLVSGGSGGASSGGTVGETGGATSTGSVTNTGGAAADGGAPATGSVSSGGGGGASGGSAPICEVADPSAGPAPGTELTITLDPSTSFQTTEGWGTSLCWFGNVLGAWSEEGRSRAADLLFDEEEGLGLNIVRYNIGGGDAPGHDHMGFGREMPGVKATEESAYDFSADAAQIQMLQDAAARIASTELIIEGFSNSPPWWMTQSGCASGADSGGSNLKDDYFDDFADFLADVSLHFRDELGLPFRTVEPLNEPHADWWRSQGSQEGCHFSHAEQARIISELRASLDDRGLPEVGIAASDETSIDDAVDTYLALDDAARAALDQINTHAYSGSQRAELYAMAQGDGKRLWASEIDGSGAPDPFDEFPHNHDDIVPGLDLAQRITRDLRQMHVDAFVFWQAVESEQAQVEIRKNWGLLHADFEGGTEEIHLTKKYHVMHQYSRFIRPGDVFIDIDEQDAVAFVNPEQGKLVIVQRNAQMNSSLRAYDLSAFAQTGTAARVFRTSAMEDHAALEDIPILEGQLVAEIAPRSVTTFVLECTSP